MMNHEWICASKFYKQMSTGTYPLDGLPIHYQKSELYRSLKENDEYLPENLYGDLFQNFGSENESDFIKNLTIIDKWLFDDPFEITEFTNVLENYKSQVMKYILKNKIILENKGITRDVINYMTEKSSIEYLYEWYLIFDEYDIWNGNYKSLFLNNRMWTYKTLYFEITESMNFFIQKNRYINAYMDLILGPFIEGFSIFNIQYCFDICKNNLSWLFDRVQCGDFITYDCIFMLLYYILEHNILDLNKKIYYSHKHVYTIKTLELPNPSQILIEDAPKFNEYMNTLNKPVYTLFEWFIIACINSNNIADMLIDFDRQYGDDYRSYLASYFIKKMIEKGANVGEVIHLFENNSDEWLNGDQTILKNKGLLIKELISYWEFQVNLNLQFNWNKIIPKSPIEPFIKEKYFSYLKFYSMNN